ncbi:hypothetical protein HDU80_010036 [Chytriomyces hyalinus]|nr:hypothetical protein HDU80_010036 [Chytriomyces hyalinus]
MLSMPSVDTNTAALAVNLRTLENKQAQLTAIQDTQQRHISDQVFDLQNRNRTFFTNLRDLPIEVIVQIFAWIPVQSVFRYRRLSTTINQCLLTSHFAMLNMQAAVFQKGSASTIGGLWLVVPQSYQAVVARAMAAQVKSVVGGDYEQADYGNDYEQFEKSLPKSISCLTAVEEIIVEGSNLLGVIPDEFGALKNLTTLCLGGNSLTGTLPSSLNLLCALEHLDVTNNQLSGDFPALPSLFKLEILSIAENCFTGPVPTVFGDPRKLTYFYVADNLFSVLPASIGQLTSLEQLLISENAFSCELPSEIWNLTNLKIVEMSGCKLFGSLAGVGALRNLISLDVTKNQFGGEFPSREILNLENLEVLHLVGNHFSRGEILDMTERNFRMVLCADRDFQVTHIVREGFRKCRDVHFVIPSTGDISDSESEESDSGCDLEFESESE